MRRGSANNNTKPIFRCGTKHDGGQCRQGNMNAADAYQLAWAAVRKILEGKWPRAKVAASSGRTLAEIDKALQRNERDTMVLTQALLDGVLTPDQVKLKSEQLRVEKERLHRERTGAERQTIAPTSYRIDRLLLDAIRPEEDNKAFLHLMQSTVERIDLAEEGYLPTRETDSLGRKRWRARMRYVVARVKLLDGSTFDRESL
jgi:hypothetical protein